MNTNLLLFIHGLGGSPEGTWGNIRELIKYDQALNSHFDVGFFKYPTGLIHLPFSSKFPRIQTLALALKTTIENVFKDYQSIVLVCHSLGGLIAKRYLLDEVINENQHHIIGLMLFAVPNNGSGLANVANHISWRHGQLAQLCKKSEFIDDLENSWYSKEIDKKIPVKYIFGAQDQVVDENSARAVWGNRLEVIPDRGHVDIVKFFSPTDVAYIILNKFVLTSVTQLPNRNPRTEKDRLICLLNLCKIILEQAQLSLEENQNTLIPFFQDTTKRTQVYNDMVKLVNNQRNRGHFGVWKGILSTIREEEADNNTVWIIVISILGVVEQLYKSFYQDGSYTDDPATKISVANALDAKNGYNEQQAVEIAKKYLDSLRNSVENLGIQIGSLNEMLQQY